MFYVLSEQNQVECQWVKSTTFNVVHFRGP
jgi:hypothetical protein